MKILLGGVPFGCNNIGDEAILNCVVKIFRRNFPEAELTVSTGTPEATAKKLGISTLPLYGFHPGRSICEFSEAVRDFDLYVWAGATGLSDYPGMGCDLLDAARAAHVPTILWQVGMNTVLNPFFFKLHGIKKHLASFAGGTEFWERILTAKMKKRIAETLFHSQLVILRDESSLHELRRCAPFPDAVAGADSAILQEMPDGDLLSFLPENRVGICISAQNSMTQTNEIRNFMDTLIEKRDCFIVFIPMNPVTDKALLFELQQTMRHQDKTFLVTHTEPEEIQNIAAHCKLIISSRLHLMILGLNHLVPAIGICRGSKISVFLDRFSLPTAGSTEHCDFAELQKQSDFLLDHQTEFKDNAQKIRQELLEALDRSEQLLKSKLC